MLDFVRFVGSLLVVLTRYINTHYITRVRHAYALLAHKVVRHQTLFIMVPISLGFVLSYPSLFAFCHSGDMAVGDQYMKELYKVDVNVQQPDFVLKQVWFQHGASLGATHSAVLDPAALDRDFLLDVLRAQEVLLRGIPREYVHTPMVWGCEQDLLEDDTPIRTLNKRLDARTFGLMAEAVSVNGIVRSAQALRILMMYPDNGTDYGSMWDHNMENLNSTFIIQQPAHERELYLLEFTRMLFVDHLILTMCYILIALYILISLSNLTMVTSKYGLLIAFITEMVLSIFSAATLTTYFSGVDLFEVPLQILPFLIIVCGVESMFRLVSNISQIPGELDVPYRLSKAMESCGLTSTLILITDLIILRLFHPFVIPNSKIFCIFAAFALVIDHILHLTFFASVLSIDICRLELCDLIEVPKKPLLKMTLPFATNLTGFCVMVCFMVFLNLRWMGHSYQKESVSDAVNFLEKKVFSDEFQSSSKILVDAPTVASHGEVVQSFVLNNAYRFDIYYVLEFSALLVFALSLSMIALKYFTASLTTDEETPVDSVCEKERSFQSKVLSGSHLLDIIKITTSRAPFVVSVGLDHKVLIWSPLSQPIPLPSQLPLIPGIWPITNVVLSDHGNYIAVFSKSGILQCWSRLSMTWLWRFEIPELKNNVALEAFFRHRTIPAFALRKQREKLLNLVSPPGSRRNSMRSITSPHLSAFSNNSNVSNELEDFVLVLKTGDVLSVACQGGSLSREKLSAGGLCSSAKLITPRVNDRLVSFTQDGKILVSTAVNNKWKSRFVTVDQYRFNNPHVVPEVVETTYSQSEISIVPFVGFMVRTTASVAELIDVQTGIMIKSFSIRSFKRGSFRVFHDQPTHCRFCGSVSIASFSVAYMLSDCNTVVMHTFTVDHHAKTSICLRVERDPREIRCVGFHQVTEHVYEQENVEGWCVTDTNQIMGVKRRVEGTRSTSTSSNGLRHRRAPRDKDRDLWEGWTMSAHGKFDTYDIPSLGNSDGLLVNSVSQVAKFGHKSIVVGFGNIMKVLYLGNADLVYNDDDNPEAISGLSFVEKRRRMKKTESSTLRSTNFGELDGIPGISDLAL